MRSGAMTALVCLVLAAPAAAERSAAARVFVRAAGNGAHGGADSAADVKKVLAEQRPNATVVLAESPEQSDLVLEVMGRHTEEKMNYDLQPPVQWTYSIVTAALIDGDGTTELAAETSALIKSWTTAAGVLVSQVAGYVEQNHHALLRRRADWPALGLDFEELNKERKKRFNVKDGKVVVTAVAPGGAAEKAGLRAGDVIATLDGEKVSSPVKLARALYARGTGTFALGVVQGGAPRTVSLAVP